jgi:hypothetical protein
LIVIDGHVRIPPDEQVAQRAVESFGSHLQEPIDAELRTLHLLLLGEAPIDYEVDDGFHKSSGDPFPVALASTVDDDRHGVVGDVGGQSGGRLDQPLQSGTSSVQGGDIRRQCFRPGQGLIAVAMPEPPLDPLQPVLQRQRLIVGVAAGRKLADKL